MAPRLELQDILEELLGSTNVYFQPPSNVKIVYPCIVYARNDLDVKFAGNAPYSKTWRYQLTVIDGNPDSEIPSKISDLPLVRFDRHFVAGNLNHEVFELYF